MTPFSGSSLVGASAQLDFFLSRSLAVLKSWRVALLGMTFSLSSRAPSLEGPSLSLSLSLIVVIIVMMMMMMIIIISLFINLSCCLFINLSCKDKTQIGMTEIENWAVLLCFSV